MLTRGLRPRLQLALLMPVLGNRDSLPLVHTFSLLSIRSKQKGSDVWIAAWSGGRSAFRLGPFYPHSADSQFRAMAAWAPPRVTNPAQTLAWSVFSFRSFADAG
jgi:hypothetical protein